MASRRRLRRLPRAHPALGLVVGCAKKGDDDHAGYDHSGHAHAAQPSAAAHRAACQALRTFGFTEEQVDELADRPAAEVLLDVRAPFAGEIVERTAVRGAVVEPGRSLFTVADRATMWAMLRVPESALADVCEGQTVELRVESLPGRVFTGRLTWVGASLDERTRLVRARAEFANPDGLLRDRRQRRGLPST